MKTPSITFVAALAIVLTSTILNASELPETLLVATAPADAKGVSDTRRNAQPGEDIVVRGRIGGTMKPLSETAAIAVLADEKGIKACSDIPGDTCETPWDFCCEPSEKLRASILTIQVRDEQGKIVRKTLRGMGGLEELSTVVVKGKVDKRSTSQALMVNAEAIFVEPAED